MPWSDLGAVDRALADALNTFNWPQAATIVDTLAARIRGESDPFPPVYTNRILRRLRRKRCFRQIQQLADALHSSGQYSPMVRRHHAQAMIDEKEFGRAQETLGSVPAATPERFEVLGLLGRIEKQVYVDAAGGGARPDPAHLQKGFEYYLTAYGEDRRWNLWHGINAAALIARAAADGVTLRDAPPSEEIAREILATINAAEETISGDLPAWDVATAMEAHVALKDVASAEQRALEYAGCCDADAFEVFSTRRQMREVWQLSENDEMGQRLLPVLDAALLRRQGGGVKISPEEAGRRLEKNFGADRFNTLAWYQEGLERCRAIARIERPGGQGHGTGWLVGSREFFPADPERKLVLTNAHVVSPEPFLNALDPEDAQVHFQMLGARFRVRRVVWCSTRFDACFLELDGAPAVEPLPLYSRTVRMTKPPSRVYVIGHPGGRDLEFSLQDSHMVDCNELLLHYRTPTEGGSSGSPVFDALGWRVVALHHAGGESMESLSNPGETYAANEGIAIGSIKGAIQDRPNGS